MTTVSTDCEQLLDLIPAYSIGATDAAETQAIESALPDCAQLRAALAELRAGLPPRPAAAEVMPPPFLRAQVLAAARSRTQRRFPVWAAAAAALLLLLGATNLYWLARTAALEGQLAAGAQVITLNAVADSPASEARARLVVADGSAVLIAENFPAPQPDQTFQAWARRDGVVISLGVFAVGDDGRGQLIIDRAALTAPLDGLGISIEPSGGSPQPTGPAVVRWAAS